MATRENYDAIIIGASKAAVFLGPALVQAGLRTALIEREYLGEVCVNVGCTPTKTMIASARVAQFARRAGEYGVNTGPVTVGLAAVRQRKRDLVSLISAFPAGLIQETEGLDLVMGEGSFIDSKSVEVRLNDGGVRQFAAARVFINTGARPSKPPIPGLDSVPSLDSTSIMELDTLPEHLLVLGGWLCWPGIWPNVPSLWQPSDHCAARQAASAAGGPRRRRGSGKHSAGRRR